MRCAPRWLLGLGLTLLSALAGATEGGIGRPITGQQITSFAGVIPPTPGLLFSVSSVYYQGDMGGSRQFPQGGAINAGLDAEVSYNLANLTYVWNTGPGRWNFASAIGLPFQYTHIQVDVSGLRQRVRTDRSTQFADILVTPIAAGYHFSETEHLSLALPIYAPTGSYDPQRLANAGQNTWTFSPTLAFTRLGGGGAEFTMMTALDFYTRNDDTNYKSGTTFRLEGIWTTAIAEGWALGAVGGWIEQVQKDSGPVADFFGGFKGPAVGAGPILNWGGKLGQQRASLSLRWVHDFEAKNRPKGNGVNLSVNLPFM